ncbi:MAG: 23S rRNA (uracil(1939)-C(5))-methyltransferase RlmD [Candidatus Omnitrophica bacterium]|nr:23S rRNA (uracil(1939)-C(5))-methyltransferase RlmD [Candidatus Omnitrophota bacterium]
MNICQHFPDCGGCRFQDTPYPEQLAGKEDRIKGLLEEFGIETELKPINSFDPWYYRNKMEFTFSQEEGELVCGLHRKAEKRKVFNAKECVIFSEHAGMILDCLREFFSTQAPYNTFTHEGFLRHLIIRNTKFTGQFMLGIVTSSQGTMDTEGLKKKIVSLNEQIPIKSLYWITNDSFGDAVTFQKKELLLGEPFVTEILGDLQFRIYIDSFFQINSRGIKTLYEKIRQYAHVTGKEKILDLYCGVGSIGLFLARDVQYVWGVELREEIVQNAKVNAQLNNIENISFVCTDVRRFLSDSDTSGIDIMVLNPPRSGLSKKIKRKILRAHPPRIVYSSCNPQTLCEDISDLASLYRVDFIEPFDFFPHTPHVECLTFLERK